MGLATAEAAHTAESGHFKSRRVLALVASSAGEFPAKAFEVDRVASFQPAE